VYGAPGQLDRPISLVPGHDYSKGHRWGMTIDTTACVGCNACVIACVSENNIPVVGKDQVARGRQMHWIRIDRYYTGDEDESPLAAAADAVPALRERAVRKRVSRRGHDAQSRGTQRNDLQPLRGYAVLLEQLSLQGAPLQLSSTTTRRSAIRCRSGLQSRRDRAHARRDGEVHLLRAAHQRGEVSREERRPRSLADGEVQTACQQACPADAIVFGDTNDAESACRRARTSERGYHVLRELNVLPSITYLARSAIPTEERMSMLRTNTARITGMWRGEAPWHARSARLPRTPGGGAPTVVDVTETVAAVVERKPSPLWYLALMISGGMAAIGIFAILYTAFTGIGVWGNNQPIGWAWDITNFVFWIGIGHAGTLISAILFLFRQKWRTAINRAAEAMTIFAVICALIFPIIHTGRPWLAIYWLLPLPNQMEMWVNFRSPLLWDVFAVSTYFTVSLMFWFVGLVPDLATLRNRAKDEAAQDAASPSSASGGPVRTATGTATRRRI
jgi:Fe-S-cluster-containing dehydrogenase component